MRPFLVKSVVFTVTFGFTAFIFANTYEVVFNRDIAFANSIRLSANHAALDGVVKDFENRFSSNSANTVPALTAINRLEIPALGVQLEAEEARRIGTGWYARPSTAHYVGLNKNKYDITVDYLMYAVKSWRTFQNPEQIEQGMEVIIYFSSGSTTLEVTEKKLVPLGRSLLVGKSEDRQILLLIEDQAGAVYYGFSLGIRK